MRRRANGTRLLAAELHERATDRTRKAVARLIRLAGIEGARRQRHGHQQRRQADGRVVSHPVTRDWEGRCFLEAIDAPGCRSIVLRVPESQNDLGRALLLCSVLASIGPDADCLLTG